MTSHKGIAFAAAIGAGIIYIVFLGYLWLWYSSGDNYLLFGAYYAAVGFIVAIGVAIGVYMHGEKQAVKRVNRDVQIAVFNETKKTNELTYCTVNDVSGNEKTGHPVIIYGFAAPSGVKFKLFRTKGRAPKSYGDLEKTGDCIVAVNGNGKVWADTYEDEGAPLGTLYYTPILDGSYTEIRAIAPAEKLDDLEALKEPAPAREIKETRYVSEMGDTVSFRYSGPPKKEKKEKNISEKAADILSDVVERSQTRQDLLVTIEKIKANPQLSEAEKKEVISRLKSMAEPD